MSIKMCAAVCIPWHTMVAQTGNSQTILSQDVILLNFIANPQRGFFFFKYGLLNVDIFWVRNENWDNLKKCPSLKNFISSLKNNKPIEY